MAAKWLSPQWMDETFTVGLNFDLPKNVAGTLSGIADSESSGLFPGFQNPKQTPLRPLQRLGLSEICYTSIAKKRYSNKQFMFFNSCIAGSTIMHLNIKIHWAF